MARFDRYGDMFPPLEVSIRSYLMAEEPFRIYGNLYFVGNTWCSSHLIDTGEGLILLDTPCFHELAYLINNIYKLGFKLADLKYIVISHEHSDHFGAAAALKHLTGAKTFTGEIAADAIEGMMKEGFKVKGDGRWDEGCKIDVRLKDGDTIELGNTVITAYDTPGHSFGCQSHFWTAYDGEESKKVGIYGGAGFSAMSKARLEANGKTVEYQQVFLDSIDHVYDQEVDIVLGNHPFHNDTFDKHEQTEATGVNAFVDPSEWHRMLDELKELYLQFIEDDRNGVKRAGHESHFLKFRDICTPYLQRPDELDRELIDFYKYYGSKAPERP